MTKPATHLIVFIKRGAPRSFWRAGLQMTREPQQLSLDELTPEQVTQIQGDHRLQVEFVTPDARQPAPARPTNQDEAINQIVQAIKQLDSDDAENWTSGGEPKVPVLSVALGWTVTRAERDLAWGMLDR